MTQPDRTESDRDPFGGEAQPFGGQEVDPEEPVAVAGPLGVLDDPSWQPAAGPVTEPLLGAGRTGSVAVMEDAGRASSPGVASLQAEASAPRLLRANLVVASGTLASRLTGLARTALVLLALGKGLNDAYIAANNTPNMIYELILGGVLSASLVPLFTEDLEHGDGLEATSAIISFAMVALLVVTAAAMLLSPVLMHLFATGAPSARRADYLAVGVPLALLFAPQVFFYGLMAVWSAALTSRHRFLAAAWAPVLNNVVAIGTLLAANRVVDGNPTLGDAVKDPTIWWILGVGTTLGIVTMALSLYPAIRGCGLRLHFRFDLKHPAVRRAVRLSGWVFGYVVANQVAVVVIQILAKPSTGDPTRYQTSFQWFQLPHALLAVSIMVTFEPLLGRADARGDRRTFNEQLLLGFRLIALLVIPAAVGYIALPIGLGSHTFHATGPIAQALGLSGIIAAFALGLPGFSTYLFSLLGFYARKDMKTPFFINCLENGVNIITAFVFVRLWGVVGLALSYALAYTCAALVSVAVLSHRNPGFDWRALGRSWLKLLVAAAVMGGVVFVVVSRMSPSSPAMLIPATGAGVVVGALTYLAAVYTLQVPGIAEVAARLPGLRRRPS